MARPIEQAQALTTNCPPMKGLNNALTPAEKSFIAAIRSFSANGMTIAVDNAAKRFLEAAPSPQALRRRAHALLRLAAQAGD
jgi:hypothetical protein